MGLFLFVLILGLAFIWWQNYQRYHQEQLQKIEEEVERKKQQKEEEKQQLKVFFSQIEKQTFSSESSGESNKNSFIISRPKGKLVIAPGNTLQEFLNILTMELSRKKTEWLVIGLFENLLPKYMVELKGRSLWVSYDEMDMFAKAQEVGATAILSLHNHPTSAIVGPSLEPSEADIRSGYSFYLKCKKRGFDFIGDFIVSGNQYQEYLISLIAKAGLSTELGKEE